MPLVIISKDACSSVGFVIRLPFGWVSAFWYTDHSVTWYRPGHMTVKNSFDSVLIENIRTPDFNLIKMNLKGPGGVDKTF